MNDWHDDGHTLTVVVQDNIPTFEVTCPFLNWDGVGPDDLYPMYPNHTMPSAACHSPNLDECIVRHELHEGFGGLDNWNVLDHNNGEFVVGSSSIPIVWYLKGGYDYWGEYNYEFFIRFKEYHELIENEKDTSTTAS